MASGGEDGGTGSASDSGSVASAEAAAAMAAASFASLQEASGPAAPSAASGELYGDLHEYGLSLGVDLEAEGEEDLLWAVQEAFNAPLPSMWTEYMDDSGRAYYVKDGSSQSTWEHPADSIYRELIDLVRKARSQPALTEEQRCGIVQDHLHQVYDVAKAEMANWSGPYASEQGEYYYNEALSVSSWESPIGVWESEFVTRHHVLSRYLLPEQSSSSGQTTTGSYGSDGIGNSRNRSMLQAFRLQLGNLQLPPGGEVPEPLTCRSFYTARSGTSSRGSRSQHSLQESKERRKERKARRDEKEEMRQRLDNLPEGASSPERRSGSKER